MKMFLKILGAVVCLGLIITAMYLWMTLGIGVYIAYTNQIRGLQYQQIQVQTHAQGGAQMQPQEPAAAPGQLLPSAEEMRKEIDFSRALAEGYHKKQQELAAQQQSQQDQQLRKQIAAMGNNMTPDAGVKEHDEAELAGKLPSLIVDPEGYDTEDNWLATGISREIAGMALFAEQPDKPLPDLKVKAVVDTTKPQVHVEIGGAGADAVVCDLSPAFAWDPEGYAPLAAKLLGGTAGAAPASVTEENDVLAHLLNLTGKALATEDVRLSANLQAHPASWQDHEAAALLLTALAMRDRGGLYTDNRPLLNRATAHLAVAQALRGSQTASWPGLIAGAAIRTLSGRELDAMAHLENLGAQADLPEAAKSWIAALRVLAKQDWREAEVTAKSPLLVKLAWFRMLETDLVPDVATARLLAVLPPPAPEVDANGVAQEAKPNPETLIPDWGRIAGKSPYYILSDDAVKNAEYKFDLEFHELDEILKTENAAPFDLDHLDKVYAERATDTVSPDADGKQVVRVIGPGVFKAASRQHLFDGMVSNDPRAAQGQDTAQMQNFFTKTEGLFHGVPGYELARLHVGFVEYNEMKKIYADWVSAGKKWPVWELAYQVATDMPGYAFVKKFYRNAVPFGTVYEADLGHRYGFINAIDQRTFPPFDTPELEKLKHLPPQQAMGAIGDYMQRYNALLRATDPKGPQPFEQELLKLAPDEYNIAQDHVTNDKLMEKAGSFLPYNMNTIERIEGLDKEHLSDADRVIVLRRHVALEPAFGFRAAAVLRSLGLEEEAVGMERKAYATSVADNPIGVSNAVLPLVDYDLTHGQNDEALKVAKSAGDTDSQMGLGTYSYALEKLGRFDEAEAAANQVKDMYSDDSWLVGLHLRHPDRYPAIYAEALKTAFPDGLVHAALADFSKAPLDGDQIKTDSDTLKGAGLRPGDVIVALDGYRIDSDAQYYFVRALKSDPKMDFIVWRSGQYLEVHATVPGRRMMVDIQDYKAGGP